jgi:hypothetical protein
LIKKVRARQSTTVLIQERLPQYFFSQFPFRKNKRKAKHRTYLSFYSHLSPLIFSPISPKEEEKIYHKCSEIQESALLILSPTAMVSLLTALAVSHPWAMTVFNKTIIENILFLNDMSLLTIKIIY